MTVFEGLYQCEVHISLQMHTQSDSTRSAKENHEPLSQNVNYVKPPRKSIRGGGILRQRYMDQMESHWMVAPLLCSSASRHEC